MSGVLGSLGQGFQFIPIANAMVPKEGPKSIALTIPFGTNASYIADLSQQVQNGVISVIQSMYVDNWNNPDPVQIQIQGSTQEIEAPPYSQGYYTILAPNPPRFTFNSSGGVTVNVQLLNVPVPADVWFNTQSATQVVSVTGTISAVSVPTSNTYTAGRASAISTASSAVLVFSAGDIVHSGVIANPPSASESLFINPVTSTVPLSGSGSTFELAPGMSYVFNGANETPIYANAATAGHAFSTLKS